MTSGLDIPEIPPTDRDALYASLEAIVMVVNNPVSASDCARILGIESAEVEAAFKDLANEYAGNKAGMRSRGFELRCIAGGWRIYSAPKFASIVGRFIVGTHTAHLSQAARETLAVIAYRQPLTRMHISHIRGVNVDGVIRTLVARGLIETVGESESGANLYGTTELFLERMGFTSLNDLEPLAPFLPPGEELEDIEHDLEEKL